MKKFWANLAKTWEFSNANSVRVGGGISAPYALILLCCLDFPMRPFAPFCLVKRGKGLREKTLPMDAEPGWGPFPQNDLQVLSWSNRLLVPHVLLPGRKRPVLSQKLVSRGATRVLPHQPRPEGTGTRQAVPRGRRRSLPVLPRPRRARAPPCDLTMASANRRPGSRQTICMCWRVAVATPGARGPRDLARAPAEGGEGMPGLKSKARGGKN